ncbi:hypothetical protein BC941DRAFT_454005 [Chlamydoabsidia padenii]|nr:hypothetical protein BC941DRAFT_454005 [Chlamydoabsidia padenii]
MLNSCPLKPLAVLLILIRQNAPNVVKLVIKIIHQEQANDNYPKQKGDFGVEKANFDKNTTQLMEYVRNVATKTRIFIDFYILKQLEYDNPLRNAPPGPPQGGDDGDALQMDIDDDTVPAMNTPQLLSIHSSSANVSPEHQQPGTSASQLANTIHDGNMTHTGDLTLAGNFIMTGNLLATGTIRCTGSLDGFGYIYSAGNSEVSSG